MNQNKKQRDNLFQVSKKLLNHPSKQSMTTLYHHIYSMKLTDEYIFKNEADLRPLINYLNTQPKVYETVE